MHFSFLVYGLHLFFLYSLATNRMYVWIPRWLCGKESACQSSRLELDPLDRKIPWSRKWQPTPVFLPGKLTEEPGGLQPLGLQRVGRELTCVHTHTYTHTELCNIGQNYLWLSVFICSVGGTLREDIFWKLLTCWKHSFKYLLLSSLFVLILFSLMWWPYWTEINISWSKQPSQ